MTIWIILSVLSSGALATPATSRSDEIASRALDVCLARQIERFDDGVLSVQELSDTALNQCKTEIELLAYLRADPELRSNVEHNFKEVVRGFRSPIK